MSETNPHLTCFVPLDAADETDDDQADDDGSTERITKLP